MRRPVTKGLSLVPIGGTRGVREMGMKKTSTGILATVLCLILGPIADGWAEYSRDYLDSHPLVTTQMPGPKIAYRRTTGGGNRGVGDGVRCLPYRLGR